MHFALPPRKSSHPPPYARPSRSSSIRQRQLQFIAVVACAALSLVFLAWRLFKPSTTRPPANTPEVVIVTIIDPFTVTLGEEYLKGIKENRDYYATKHGYTTFYPNSTSYDLGTSPQSWAVIPALRHAMSLYPHSTYFFALSPHALIMNPSVSLSSHILFPPRLESILLKDQPIVPPDSVIKTIGHLQGPNIDLVLTQDNEGLCDGSFILRGGEWAQYFLDAWFDPLYRSYNFQKAESHALEHIIQWHSTILTKLALIPQRLLNSYGLDIPSRGGSVVMYEEGDFVVRFPGCESDVDRHCDQEMGPYFNTWKNGIEKRE